MKKITIQKVLQDLILNGKKEVAEIMKAESSLKGGNEMELKT